MANKTEAVEYGYVSPGTAGVAQRVEFKYNGSGEKIEKEKSKLFALTHNDILQCGHNQY